MHTVPVSLLRRGGCRRGGIFSTEALFGQAGRSVADARGGLRGHVGGFRLRVLRGVRSFAGGGAIEGSFDGERGETPLKKGEGPSSLGGNFPFATGDGDGDGDGRCGACVDALAGRRKSCICCQKGINL